MNGLRDWLVALLVRVVLPLGSALGLGHLAEQNGWDGDLMVGLVAAGILASAIGGITVLFGGLRLVLVRLGGGSLGMQAVEIPDRDAGPAETGREDAPPSSNRDPTPGAR